MTGKERERGGRGERVIEITETSLQAVSLQFRPRVDGVRQVSLCSRAFPDEWSRAQRLKDRSISDLKREMIGFYVKREACTGNRFLLCISR